MFSGTYNNLLAVGPGKNGQGAVWVSNRSLFFFEQPWWEDVGADGDTMLKQGGCSWRHEVADCQVLENAALKNP